MCIKSAREGQLRVLKLAGWSMAGLIVVLVVAIFGAWTALRPPALPVAEQQSVILSNVTLINPGLERIEGATIVSEGTSITRVSRTPQQESFSCEGCFVLPGLMDSHVHFPPQFAVGQQEQFALLLLGHGVTSVRDAGSADQSTFSLRDRISEGDLVGPRIFTCGPIVDGDPSVFPTNVPVSNATEAERAVRDLHARGADCIKAYNMLTPEAFDSLAATAAELGLPLMGHVPHRVGLEGVTHFDVQHVTGAVRYPPDQIGFDDYIFRDIADLSDDRIQEIVEIALENRISFTPTLVNQVRRRTWADEERFAPDPVAEEMPRFWPPAWRRIFGGPFSLYTEEDHTRHLIRQRELTLALYRAGVPIRAGTDTMMPWATPGSALIGELHELVRAGLSPEEALTSATLTASEFFPNSRIGRVAEGYFADLVIYQEDPTQDLAALDTLVAVVVNGRLYTREELDSFRSTYAQHFRYGFYDGFMTPAMNSITGSFAPEGD